MFIILVLVADVVLWTWKNIYSIHLAISVYIYIYIYQALSNIRIGYLKIPSYFILHILVSKITVFVLFTYCYFFVNCRKHYRITFLCTVRFARKSTLLGIFRNTAHGYIWHHWPNVSCSLGAVNTEAIGPEASGGHFSVCYGIK